MQNPMYSQLNVGANEANRLFWNEKYFSLEVVLLFPTQMNSEEDVKTYLENATLVLKLTPFKNQFRAKMLASLLENENIEESEIIGLTATINIKSNKLLDILDIRQINTTLDGEGTGSLNAAESKPVDVSDAKKTELIQALQKLAEGNLKPHLQQPFVSFSPEFLDDQWTERLPKQKNKSALLPFQAIFPFSGGIERIHENQMYALDDLYCVNPSCNCNEVTCIVLTFDPNSGKEITHGGFKYNLEKNTFKSLPNFPTQFNSQEWFRQFSKDSSISLQLALKSRYQFLRKQIAFLNK
ncbi:hypothetical protein [Fluviispira multicolorata]|uniref:Uncharacterized protein n=1 Tax=Fluviispira multicolorata TaxID=2654512 RepID=A0A833JFC2_9BACT|nr:hypothetical protein [Fluviispira multicolorata]KAB8033674.1 hypothetical protein GCL57_02915 [Fluviispira multicolorata]